MACYAERRASYSGFVLALLGKGSRNDDCAPNAASRAPVPLVGDALPHLPPALQPRRQGPTQQRLHLVVTPQRGAGLGRV